MNPERNQSIYKWGTPMGKDSDLSSFRFGKREDLCGRAQREETPVPSEVKITPRKSDNGETLTLSCMVTGLCSRDVDVNWVKNGETTLNNTISSRILPNEDRTFQIQKSIEIHPADTNTYSCQVEHSSLNSTLNIPYDPRVNDTPTVIPGIIIGGGILGILIVTAAGFLAWKCKEKGTRREGYTPHNLNKLQTRHPTPQTVLRNPTAWRL
ncbi:major histocompatibility complex class I-related gene protein-like [Latimeria chalumnae]|uniref:major histocompatibility complex class I-related gene protein-like n=1 Tax=Latimeria chalumnae TaxID=7897 RepID=UPI00313B7086